MKKILNALYSAVLFIWQILQNIVALLMMPFLGKLTLLEHRNHQYVFEAEKMSGGISLGTFIFISPKLSGFQEVHEHELGHGFDSRKFGPLYLFIIGIPSIIWAMVCDESCQCYYDFYTERWANENIGTVKVVKDEDGTCYLDMK
jgi:hypothetical protein